MGTKSFQAYVPWGMYKQTTPHVSSARSCPAQQFFPHLTDVHILHSAYTSHVRSKYQDVSSGSFQKKKTPTRYANMLSRQAENAPRSALSESTSSVTRRNSSVACSARDSAAAARASSCSAVSRPLSARAAASCAARRAAAARAEAASCSRCACLLRAAPASA